MNVKLLRKVAKHISEEPRRLNMRHFISDDTDAPCGTAGCIAGWACMLSSISSRDVDWEKGQGLLGLSDEQSSRLFCPPEWDRSERVPQWPKSFRLRYQAAKNPEARAKIAVKRIEHFIKTKGAE